MNNTPIILTDCDGVLLNWLDAFERWLVQHGYSSKDASSYDLSVRFDIHFDRITALVKQFNESAWIGFLDPIDKHVIESVKNLHEKFNFRFIVITSLGVDEYAKRARIQNLNNLFGSAILETIVLDTDQDKDTALSKYKDSRYWWIEDKPKNVIAGLTAGLRPIMYSHSYNESLEYPGITVARDWKEIYEIITKEL